MKKLLSILIIAVMLIGIVPFAFAADLSASPAIALGETKKVEASRTNVESFFKFVPTETAEYAFYSTLDNEEDYIDTYGYILDDKGEIIAANDDDGLRPGVNFGIWTTLEKGKTYFLASRLYRPTEKGDYNVSIVKTGTKATSIVPEKTEYTVYVGSKTEIHYTFAPYGCFDDGVSIASSNPDVIRLVEGSQSLAAVAEGTANVTLTSDSGLTATVKFTVLKPKALAFNTPYSSTIVSQNDMHIFVFTPAESGYYTINATASSRGYLYVDGIAGDDGTEMSVSGYFEADCEYAIELSAENDDFAYTIEATKAKKATDFYIVASRGNVQVTHFSQELDAYGVDGVLEGEFEWSVDNEEIAVIMPTVSSSTFLSFNKAGTVTVTAKWNGKTQTYTVTGKDPAVITTAQSHTEKVVGFDNYVYTSFTPETSGVYKFTVNDSANAPIMLQVEGYGQSSDGYYTVHLEAGVTYIACASRFQVSYDYDENLTGDITIAVKQAAEPTGIVIDGGDTFTGYVNNEVHLTVSATNENGVINSPISWSIEGTEEYELNTYNESASIYFHEVGEYTVTASTDEFTDSIKVKVMSPDKIKLGEKKNVSVNEIKPIHIVQLDVEKAGVYTVRVKSDKPVCAEAAFSNGRNNSGTDFEMGIAALSLEPTYIVFFGVATTDANFTIELVNTDFPMGVRPILPDVTLGVGETYWPGLIFEPSDVQEDITSMVSSNTNVVKIEYDTIVAVGKGTATVEITTEYGLKTKLNVTVVGDDYDWATNIKLDKRELALEAGKSASLKATVEAESDKKVVWTSLDQSVARVDENGRVTAIAEGTTTILASVDNVDAACIVTVTAPKILDSTKKFTDVKAGKWYSAAIDYCYTYGFIKGKTDTTFNREDNITRAEFITILARIAGVNTSGAANKVNTKFTDVKTGKFYTAAIKWANENGIVNGTSETLFSPEANISRQDICVMVTRFASYMNVELKSLVNEIQFTDTSAISKYAKKSVNTCQKAGLIKGYNDGSFGPQKPAQRAEAAQILYLFHSNFIVK